MPWRFLQVLCLKSIAKPGIYRRKAVKKYWWAVDGGVLLKKVIAAGIVVVILACLAPALFGGEGPDAGQETIKPVRVMKVSADITPVVLEYTGIVAPGDVRQMSFKSSGRIAGIYVEEGQWVKKGDMLAALDTKELLHAKEDTVQELKSALNALEFCQSECQRMEALYREGAVSFRDLEKARLDRDLQQAAGIRAEVNMKNIQSRIEDAVLAAEMDAFVTDVSAKEGEMAAAGYPVVIIRSGDLVVNAGLSEVDAIKVKPGTPVRVKVGDREVFGQADFIDPVPDEATRTYNAKVVLRECPFNIGAVVKLEILLGEEEGIWIPVTSVMVDGEDYIYIVENDRVVRKRVDISGSRSSRVRVSGLNPGDILVIEGHKNLKDGDRVSINW